MERFVMTEIMFRKKIAVIAVFLLGKTYGQITGDVFVLNRDRDLFYAHYTPDISDNSSFDYQRLSGKLGFAPIFLNKLAFFNTIGMAVFVYKLSTGSGVCNRDLRYCSFVNKYEGCCNPVGS